MISLQWALKEHPLPAINDESYPLQTVIKLVVTFYVPKLSRRNFSLTYEIQSLATFFSGFQTKNIQDTIRCSSPENSMVLAEFSF